MSNIPEVHHWLAGDDFNATRMNEIKDQIDWLRNPPMVQVGRRSTVQTIAAGTWTKVSFDTVFNSYDPYGFYSAGTPNQLTVNEPGWYTCELVTSMAGFTNDTRMIMGLYKNGFTAAELLMRYDQTTLPNSGNLNMRKEATLFFNVGDVMYFGLFTNDSVSRNTAITSDSECTRMRVRWVST